jgi:hypothetical protein
MCTKFVRVTSSLAECVYNIILAVKGYNELSTIFSFITREIKVCSKIKRRQDLWKEAAKIDISESSPPKGCIIRC